MLLGQEVERRVGYDHDGDEWEHFGFQFVGSDQRGDNLSRAAVGN